MTKPKFKVGDFVRASEEGQKYYAHTEPNRIDGEPSAKNSDEHRRQLVCGEIIEVRTTGYEIRHDDGRTCVMHERALEAAFAFVIQEEP